MASNRSMWAVRVVRGALVGVALAGLYGMLADPRADEAMLRDYKREHAWLESVAARAREAPFERCADAGFDSLRAHCEEIAIDRVQVSPSEVRLTIARAGGLRGHAGYAWRTEPPEHLAARVGPHIEPPTSAADACAPVYRHIDGPWYLFVTRC